MKRMQLIMSGFLVSVVFLLGLYSPQSTFSASAETAKPISLRFHTHIPNVGAEGAAISKYCDEVKRLSGGRVNVNVFWGAVLCKPREELEAVQHGRVDMAMTVMSYNPAKLPLGRISRPVLFGTSNPAITSKIARKLYGEFPEMRNELEKYNHHPLAFGSLGTYELFSKSPIKVLDDLKGKKIASTGADHPKALKAIGAVPVAMPSGERYQALHTGVVEGSLLGLETQFSRKFHEVAKYITLMNLGAIYAYAITINKDVWAKFQPDTQKAFLDAGPTFEEFYGAEIMRLEQKLIADLKASGAQVFELSESDRMKWAKELPDMPKEFIEDMEAKGLPGRKIMNRYLQLMEEMGHKFPRRWGPY